MSRFYGTTQGQRGMATRCGHRGLVSQAAGWKGAIRVELARKGDDDVYRVWLIPWANSTGARRLLAEGVLDATTDGNTLALDALRVAGRMSSGGVDGCTV